MKHWIGSCVAVLLLSSSPGWAVTEAECKAQGFANVVRNYRHRQVVYDGVRRMDMYLPATGAAPAPTIVYVHGGGWKGANWRFECETGLWAVNRLAEGFAIASVEYTEAAPPPATLGGTADNVVRQVREIKHAIRVLKARRTEHSLDPTRFIIAGGSAGGHLSVLTALTEGERLYDPIGAPAGVNSRVSYVFAYAGIYDIATYEDPFGIIPPTFGCWRPSIYSWRPCSEETIRRASPVHHVDAGDPRVYLLHGDQDFLVPSSQSQQFARALCGAGRLSYYNLAISGPNQSPPYQHNLEYFLAGNPYLGAMLLAGINGQITANCP